MFIGIFNDRLSAFNLQIYALLWQIQKFSDLKTPARKKYKLNACWSLSFSVLQLAIVLLIKLLMICHPGIAGTDDGRHYAHKEDATRFCI
jgi:hypothetical protein